MKSIHVTVFHPRHAEITTSNDKNYHEITSRKNVHVLDLSDLILDECEFEVLSETILHYTAVSSGHLESISPVIQCINALISSDDDILYTLTADVENQYKQMTPLLSLLHYTRRTNFKHALQTLVTTVREYRQYAVSIA